MCFDYRNNRTSRYIVKICFFIFWLSIQQVDNQDGNYTTLTDASPVQFTMRGALVAGGVEYNMTRYGLDGAGGYEGCIAGD